MVYRTISDDFLSRRIYGPNTVLFSSIYISDIFLYRKVARWKNCNSDNIRPDVVKRNCSAHVYVSYNIQEYHSSFFFLFTFWGWEHLVRGSFPRLCHPTIDLAIWRLDLPVVSIISTWTIDFHVSNIVHYCTLHLLVWQPYFISTLTYSNSQCYSRVSICFP